MKLEADWLSSGACVTLRRMFEGAGADAFFVGGCVRNALMDVPVSDLDLATPLRPEQVIELAKHAGVKVIPTGLEHGTVTLVVGDTAFEITTFRNDVQTDGRHARVAFSDDMKVDAERRDFTMNALYADFDGKIFDPLGGQADLNARRVRFIGCPADRIGEDYLRILRFFRFHAQYGDHAQGLDAEALAACAENLDGLAGLSRERVGSEVLKLLAAKDPSTAIGAMEAAGVLGCVLPASSGRALYPFLIMELSFNLMARLAALGGERPQQALRLSSKQVKEWALYREALETQVSLKEIAQHDGKEIALGVAVLRAAIFEQPLMGDEYAAISRASEAVFPVSALDLMPQFSGVELGLALKRLKADWIASDFALTRPELLRKLGKP